MRPCKSHSGDEMSKKDLRVGSVLATRRLRRCFASRQPGGASEPDHDEWPKSKTIILESQE